MIGLAQFMMALKREGWDPRAECRLDCAYCKACVLDVWRRIK